MATRWVWVLGFSFAACSGKESGGDGSGGEAGEAGVGGSSAATGGSTSAGRGGGAGATSGGRAGSTGGSLSSGGSLSTGGSAASGGSGADRGTECEEPAATDSCECPPCPTWTTVPLPSDESYQEVYAARDGRVFLAYPGVFYTDTLDGTWLPATLDLETTAFDVLQDLDGGRLLATGVVSARATLFESADAGVSWTAVALEANAAAARGAITPQGLYVSSNGLHFRANGESVWRRSGSGDALAANANGDVFTSMARYRPSVDHWVDLREQLMAVGSGEPVLAIDQGIVFLKRGLDGLWASEDLGESYEQIWHAEFDALAANANGVVVLLDEQLGPFVRRADGWAQLGPARPASGVSFLAVALLPDGRVATLWKPSAGRTELAVTTEPVPAEPYPPAGVASAACHDGELSPGEEDVDCGGDCASCAIWRLSVSVPPNNVFFASKAGTIFAADLNGGLFRSVDDGKSWQVCERPEGLVENGANPPELAMAGAGTVYQLFPGPDGALLLRSTDDGETFTEIGPAPVVAPLVLTDDAMFIHNGGDAYRSVDEGATWDPIESPGVQSGLFALDSGNLYVNTGSNTQVSEDAGDSWALVELPADGRVYPLDGTTLWLHDDTQLYLSEDGGVSWDGLALPAPPEYPTLYRTPAGRLVYLDTEVYVKDAGDAAFRSANDFGRFAAFGVAQFADGRIAARSTSTTGLNLLLVSTDPALW